MANQTNTRNENTGRWNTGRHNTGDGNTGNGNVGHWNTGDGNTGNGNVGDRNAGTRNAGTRNAGTRNAGDWNTGSFNTGDRNAGDGNTGGHNTGHYNAGDGNTGNRNTGCFNTGNLNTGFFNTGTPGTVTVFDSAVVDSDEFIDAIPDWLSFVELTSWIPENIMTDQQKIDNPTFHTTGGFLQTRTMKEAFAVAWADSDKDVEAVRAMPGFDEQVWVEITGIVLDTGDATEPAETIVLNGVTYRKETDQS